MIVHRLLAKRIFVAVVLFLLALGSFIYWFFFLPPSATSVAKIVLIKKGTALRRISELLQQEGIIKERHLFVLLSRALGKKGDIKAGEYELHTRMLPLEILAILVNGQVKTHLVTIPEGYTLQQIAQLLNDLHIVDRQAFLQKAASPDFIASLAIPRLEGPNLEGYLFPNTYHLVKEMEPGEVIRMMINQFKKTFTGELSSRALQTGISDRDAVILASIIEKETPLAEEKPLISAVFHNRLRRKMPLQSDPTVIYGISDFDGNLKKQQLLTPSAYNTYTINGLPPTPICNPGRESLLAAVSPASVPYLYFVSKNDGSHYFSAHLDEHNRAVSKYQKKN